MHGDEEQVKKVALKGRFEGVPYTMSESTKWMWVYDDKGAQADMKVLKDNEKRMSKKFEEAENFELIQAKEKKKLAMEKKVAMEKKKMAMEKKTAESFKKMQVTKILQKKKMAKMKKKMAMEKKKKKMAMMRKEKKKVASSSPRR